MRELLLRICMTVGLAGCGGGGGPGPDVDPDAGPADPPPDAAASAADAGPEDRCPPPAGDPSVVYYFAIGDPAASNETCNGLAPTDEGSGRCPFRDFESLRTRLLLVNVADVRVELRAGIYPVSGFGSEGGLDGVPILGAGTSDDQRVVLAAYRGEEAILDGGRALREVVMVGGQHVAVEGITIRNGGGYNLEVRGAQHVSIRCNRFLDNGSSDSLKGDGGAGFVDVRDNLFTGWDSQAIDMTQVHDWLIEDNEFHSPGAADGGAVGTKFGARDITVRRNFIHDVYAGVGTGTSAVHPEQFEAFGIVWEQNRFRNLTGVAVKLYSCDGCTFRDNDIDGAQAGALFTDADREGPSGCPGGCRPSRNAVITGNRMRGMTGPPADAFIATYTSETAGLSASGNLYCASAIDTARFGLDEVPVNFAAWTAAVGTDTGSTVAAAGDASCTSW